MLVPVTSGGVPSTWATSQRLTVSRLVGASPRLSLSLLLLLPNLLLAAVSFACQDCPSVHSRQCVYLKGAGPFPFLIDRALPSAR